MTYAPPPGSIPTLETPSLDGVRRMHMIGIGGAGMSGIAQLLLARGIKVTGSDLKESRGLGTLRAAGADVWVGHAPERIGHPDLVVVSTAIPATDAERVAAANAGLPVVARAQVLAALAAGSHAVAVAGTHGKTTTTSMLAVILERTSADPTFLIGGDLNESGSGARSGAGPDMVAEADESDGSFLLLDPAIGIVTNVEEDHLDFYGSGASIVEAFAAFMARCGEVIANGDDEGVRAAVAQTDAAVLLFGAGDADDLDARVSVEPAEGCAAQATLHLPGGGNVALRLQVPGVHNLLNATAAVLASIACGVDPAAAVTALEGFTGVRRRFEPRGEAASGARFVDDYAHHPTEIAATLEAAAGADGHKRLIAIFQPHRYSRTRDLWRGLGESLDAADVVVVTDVYAAGEDPIPGVSGKLLVDALAESGRRRRTLYLPRHTDVVRFLAGEVGEGDLVLTMGAGDITTVPDETLERLAAGEA